MIIGLTGRFGSGCTETSKFFHNTKGMEYFSISALLKEKAKKKVKDFDKKQPNKKRMILQDLGDELRKKNPENPETVAPIVEEICKRKPKKAVIECFRNPHEIETFQRKFKKHFVLLSIDASHDKRWDRLKDLFKHKDEFGEIEKRDAGDTKNLHGQQVKKCMEMADISVNAEEDFFDCDGTKNGKIIDSYAQRLSDFYDLIENSESRPPYPNEAYMHQACSVALQSRCSKRQVGAVIVRDTYSFKKELDKEKLKGAIGYVIATGCNNVPYEDEDCKKKYPEKCYRAKIKKEFLENNIYCRKCGHKLEKNSKLCVDCGFKNEVFPGKLLSVCRAVHAEEAAIIQAARLGSTSLHGTKLYTSAFPCMLCCKKIIASGIIQVVYLEAYPMEESLAIDMFKTNNVDLKKYEGVTTKSFHRFFKRNL